MVIQYPFLFHRGWRGYPKCPIQVPTHPAPLLPALPSSMPNTLQVIPPALCFIPSVVALVLAARVACSASSHRSPLLSWLVISLLAIFESTAGIIGLNATTGFFALYKAELVVQTCLYALLGVSVLYLAYTYSNPIPWLPPSTRASPCTLVLSLFLSCATILGLAAPFLSSIPSMVSPLIFLTFTLSTIPLLAHLIHVHRSNHPPNAVHPRLSEPCKLQTTPTSMASYASVSISPKVKPKPAGSASSTRLPNLNTAITVLIPPPLPSPASSSASFPSSSDQTHKPGTGLKSHEGCHHPSGSSCSAVTIPSPKSAKVRDSACDTGMDADVPIEHPRGSRLLITKTSSSGIREKVGYMRIRARNILLLLLIAQLCAVLSGTLLLILGVNVSKPSSITRNTSLLRVVETTFTIICVCGFMQAFYLHAYRMEKDGAIVRSQGASGRQEMKQQDEEAGVDMMPRVDDGNYPASPTQNSSKNLGIMKVPSPKAGPRKFRMFSGSDVSTTKKHQRFASASSSFSSPRPKRTPIIIFEPNTDARGPSRANRYSEVEDEGIELPILVSSGNAHLPSPPATPRMRDIGSQWSQKQTQEEEEVRVGIMRPEIRVKVVREMEPNRYLEVAADVIDTASSEPGCSSHLAEDGTSIEKVEIRSPRVQFSCPASPTLPSMGPQSPTISTQSPTMSMGSPKSPTLSFMSSPTSRSAWRRAEKIRARLKRPLSTHLYPARSASSDLVLEGRLSRNIQHRRTGSKIQEWYPFTSKAGRRETGSREGDDYSAGHADTADFVDLTDPFASPTPGYVLPKWVNSAASEAGHSGGGCEDGGRTLKEKQYMKAKARGGSKMEDARSDDHGIWSDERCYLIGGSERPLVKSKSTSWGKLPMISDTKEQTTVANFPASLRNSSYVCGTSKPKPETKKERGPVFKSESKAKERGSPRYGKRPDSPFPMATKEDIESTPCGLKRMDSPIPLIENRIRLTLSRSSSSLQASIKSKESPSSFKPLPTRLQSPEDADILDGIGGMSRRRPISQVIPQATSGERGKNVGIEEKLQESPVIKDATKQPPRRKRNGSPVPLKSTPLRRKGSPIPMPFRSSPTSSNNTRRLAVGVPSSPVSIPKESPRSWKKSSESERRRDSLRKQVEKEDILEEVLLAQRLLRRLDSAYDDYT